MVEDNMKTIVITLGVILFILLSSNAMGVVKILEIQPSDNSVDNCPCCLAICANFSNTSGDTVKMAFQSNYSGSWSNLEDTRIVNADEMICLCVPEFVWFNYTYYWRLLYYDGGAQYSENYSLTTAQDADNCPCGESCLGDIEVYDGYSMIGLIGIIGILGFLIMYRRKKQNVG